MAVFSLGLRVRDRAPDGRQRERRKREAKRQQRWILRKAQDDKLLGLQANWNGVRVVPTDRFEAHGEGGSGMESRARREAGCRAAREAKTTLLGFDPEPPAARSEVKRSRCLSAKAAQATAEVRKR